MRLPGVGQTEAGETEPMTRIPPGSLETKPERVCAGCMDPVGFGGHYNLLGQKEWLCSDCGTDYLLDMADEQKRQAWEEFEHDRECLG